jgi:UDP-glucose 4-epimerase
MDWVHVRDVARANILAAQSPVASGVFNVGTGVETSLHGLAELVLKSWGRSGKPEVDLSHSPVNPIPRRWADISAARKHLGFQPEIPLDKGLAEMVEWWKKHARVA